MKIKRGVLDALHVLAMRAADYVACANFPEREHHAQGQIDVGFWLAQKGETAKKIVFKEIGECDLCGCSECAYKRNRRKKGDEE